MVPSRKVLADLECMDCGKPAEHECVIGPVCMRCLNGGPWCYQVEKISNETQIKTCTSTIRAE